MGKEFVVSSLEEMCALMCDNVMPEENTRERQKINAKRCEQRKINNVLEDIKAELWMEGMNMTGEYQGVWVRFRDIEKIIEKHISGKETE